MSSGKLLEGSKEILERHVELGVVRDVLRQTAHGEGGTFVVLGPAGIGKTTLLDCAVEEARGAGFQVLTARGAELESHFPFGLAHQLLTDALPQPVDLEPGVAIPDDHQLTARLYRLTFTLATLAESRPLLLCVDDAHWADEPSRQLLRFLARRTGDVRMALALSARPEYDGVESQRLWGEYGARLLTPQPLSLDAVAHLLESQPDAIPQAFEATQGNPFLVNEVVRALRAGESIEDIARSGRAAGLERTRRLTALRLQRIGATASAIAEALAVLGDGAGAAEVAALADVSLSDALDAMVALEQSDFVRAGVVVRFTHPLIRECVLANLGPARVTRLHQRAQMQLLRAGAAARRVAHHALHAPPAGDRRTVLALREAAAEALREGDCAVATTLLERALAEPPDGGEIRTSVQLLLGQTQLRAGKAHAALQTLRDAAAPSLPT